MKFDTLEKEFEYYHDLLEWKSIFTAIKGYTPLDHKDMSTIIDSIIIGVTTGLSTVEASSKFENTRKLLNNEKFKDFLFKITEKAQQSGKLVTRNLRSFNSLRMALVFAEVYRILEEKGISEPEAIAEKILISSIQSISENEDIESSENIRVKWASLLANTSLGTVKNKSFLKILDELEHKDAVVLDYIYHNSDGKVHTHHGMQKGVKFRRMSKIITSNIDNIFGIF